MEIYQKSSEFGRLIKWTKPFHRPLPMHALPGAELIQDYIDIVQSGHRGEIQRLRSRYKRYYRMRFRRARRFFLFSLTLIVVIAAASCWLVYDLNQRIEASENFIPRIIPLGQEPIFDNK